MNNENLHDTTDHYVWAAEFNKTAQELGYPAMDEEWLAGWFANAMMAKSDSEARTRNAA